MKVYKINMFKDKNEYEKVFINGYNERKKFKDLEEYLKSN